MEFILTILFFTTASRSAVITPIVEIPAVLVDHAFLMDNSDKHQQIPVDFQTALNLYTVAEEASQSIDEVYITYFSNFQNKAEYFFDYCYYTPLQSNLYGCNFESLDEDLNLLTKLKFLYTTVINYEEDNGTAGYIALMEMKEAGSKVMELIDYLKETLKTEGSGGNNIVYDSHQMENAATSHCYECNSAGDQYKIVMEIKAVIEITVNHSKCVKEELATNSYTAEQAF